MAKARRTAADVLAYSIEKCSRSTVRRFYLEWRRSQGLPEGCDNQQCRYFTAPLEWNGKPLPLILDHTDGNSKNNSPSNLRLLCPNCDAQLMTRGGRNRGRIQNVTAGGYEVAHRDGRRDANVFPRGVSATGYVGDIEPKQTN